MTLYSGGISIKAVKTQQIVMISLYLSKTCKANSYKIADVWTVVYNLLFEMTLRPEWSNLAGLKLVLKKWFTAPLGPAGE